MIARFATRPLASRALFAAIVPATLALLPTVASAQGHAGHAAPAVDKSSKIGPGLYEVVAGEGGSAVYVASTGSREPAVGAKIYALDPVTLAVKSTIDVASAPAYGLAINNKTQTLYTTNTRSSSVSAIDLKTGKVIATIKSPTDSSAHLFRITVDEASNMVYAAIAANPGKIWIIDGKTNTFVAKIDSIGRQASAIAVDAANNRLFVTSIGTNEIGEIDLKTRKVVKMIPSGGTRPTQLAFDAKTNRLFVTNQTTGDLTVIDTKTGTLAKTVKTGEGALGIAFDANANRVYVANRVASTVTVVDGASYNVLANLKAGSLPNTVTIDSKTGAVYVTSKAKSAGRGAAPTVDENGDTVTRIK
jgi:YVTN family beta-propeller protein